MVDLLRRLKAGLVVAGAVMTVVGALGLVLGWGSSRSHATAVVSSSSSADEDPRSFFDAFENAVRSGDRTFLVDRMHPAVIARYGRSQCQTFAAQLVDPSASLHVVNVTGPVTYDYASDGRSTQVPGTYVFDVDGTAAGQTGPRQYHFAVVNGQFRSFADCGDPIAGG